MKKIAWALLGLVVLASSSEAGIFHRHKGESKGPTAGKPGHPNWHEYGRPEWGTQWNQIFDVGRVHLTPYLRFYKPIR